MPDHNASGLHTPQHWPELEPRPDPEPEQDDGGPNPFLDQLAGRNTEETAYIDVSDVESLDGISMTDLYEGETDPNQEPGEGGVERFDLLVEQELREGETDDVMEAVEEGMTYVPPIDPPVVPDRDRDNRESVQVAAGFGLTAADQGSDPDAFDADNERAFERGDDMTAMVRRALRADSQTTHLADILAIATINGTVIVRGLVDDLDDTDNIVAVISELPGVESVRDETTVRGL